MERLSRSSGFLIPRRLALPPVDRYNLLTSTPTTEQEDEATNNAETPAAK
jgi:hypothetical protein